MTDVADIKSYHYDSGKQGPHLLVFGAVHGQEKCGTQAINKWITKLDQGKAILAQGSVTFVPICNPRAYAQNTRSTDANLNRVYIRKDPEIITVYEEKIAQELMNLIDQCDYLLDLHSTKSSTAPFVFQDSDDVAHKDFTDALGIEHIVVGWNHYFNKQATPQSGLAYAIRNGKTGAVIECGSHDGPTSIDVAKQSIGHALAYLEMIALPRTEITSSRFQLCDHFMETQSGDYTQNWRGFDFVAKDTIIAHYADGTPLIAQQDCFILMPSPNDHSGDIWFYLVKKI